MTTPETSSLEWSQIWAQVAEKAREEWVNRPPLRGFLESAPRRALFAALYGGGALVVVFLAFSGLATVLIDGERVLTNRLTEIAHFRETPVALDDTAASVTLPSPHWYAYTTDMVVTSSIDGDVTASAALNVEDRQTIIITRLTGEAPDHTIDVGYRAATPTGLKAILIRILPTLAVVVGVGAILGAAAIVNLSRSGVVGGTFIGLGGTVVLPGVLKPAAIAYEIYEFAPEYTAMTVALTLVPLGYMVAIMLVAYQSFLVGRPVFGNVKRRSSSVPTGTLAPSGQSTTSEPS